MNRKLYQLQNECRNTNFHLKLKISNESDMTAHLAGESTGPLGKFQVPRRYQNVVVRQIEIITGHIILR